MPTLHRSTVLSRTASAALPLALIHCGSTAAIGPQPDVVTLPDGATVVAVLPDGAPVTALPDGATVVTAPDGEVTVVTVPDASVAMDGGGGGDAGGGDASVLADGAPVGPPDAFTGSLVGSWRVVRYRAAGDNRQYDLTDHDTPQRFGPVTVDVRVNGLMRIRTDRYHITFAGLLGDHAYVREDVPGAMVTWPDVLSIQGAATPSMLDGDTLVTPDGTRTLLVRNADGTIELEGMGGESYTFAHVAMQAAGPAQYTARGGAVWFGPTTHVPFRGHARFALAWDRPGVTGGYTYANDAPIVFDSFGNANYDVTVAAPPSGTVGTVGGTHVAVGYPFAYDDVDSDGHFVAGTDTLRGASTLALSWRDGTVETPDDLATSAFRDVPPGFAVAHVHPDYSLQRDALGSLDDTTGLSPDLALDAANTATITFPDLVR